MPGIPVGPGIQPSPSIRYSIGDLKAAAAKAGFTGNALVVAVAISLAENGSMNPTTVSKANSDGSHDHGAWQINDKAHPDLMRKYNVHTLQGNADAAYAVYKAAGNRWTPWTVYNTHAYAAHLPEAQKAKASDGGPLDIAGIVSPAIGIGELVTGDKFGNGFVTGALKNSTDLMGHLLDPAFWVRIGIAVGAIALLVIGVLIMLESNHTIASATKTAAKVGAL